MQGVKAYIGIDMKKEYLDAAKGRESGRFAKKARGHRELVSWVQTMAGPVQVIFEASGGYERELVQVLQESEIAVSLVQASRVPFCPSMAGVPPCAAAYICPSLSRPATTRSCASFINACAPPAKHPNSLPP
jgi:hypothetical protein